MAAHRRRLWFWFFGGWVHLLPLPQKELEALKKKHSQKYSLTNSQCLLWERLAHACHKFVTTNHLRTPPHDSNPSRHCDLMSVLQQQQSCFFVCLFFQEKKIWRIFVNSVTEVVEYKLLNFSIITWKSIYIQIMINNIDYTMILPAFISCPPRLPSALIILNQWLSEIYSCEICPYFTFYWNKLITFCTLYLCLQLWPSVHYRSLPCFSTSCCSLWSRSHGENTFKLYKHQLCFFLKRERHYDVHWSWMNV